MTKITDNQYYCSQKFWWMTVEPERRSMSSCCAASTEKIDLDRLKDNPGQLFNTPNLQRERQQMLENNPVAGCEDTCWQAERAGLPSRRTRMGSTIKSHVDVISSPTVLHVNLGSDCNLTCSYCCKQYSTAWLRDVNKHGPYLDETRFHINNNDRMVLQLGQNTIKSSKSYQLILDEIKNIKTATMIEISGGEPLLYNKLDELVASLPGPVNIFTGLGVDSKRLGRILDTLPDTTTFTVSAENTGKLYEFNRYGNTWDNFCNNLELIKQKFDYKFCMVLSNLTIHGLEEFKRDFGTNRDIVNLCTDPIYLSASVLDPESKTTYQHALPEFGDTITVDYQPEQKQKLKQYVYHFVKNRNLDLNIFPKHFINWMNQ
jgi:wyosine [tRNA(Phe)-imidazoG37] synthetase (radical SAM superfamily)